MKSSVPGIAQKARLLLQSSDGVTGCCSSLSSSSVASALKATAQYATFTPAPAAGKPPVPGTPPSKPLGPGKQPAPPAAAAAAGTAGTVRTSPVAPAASKAAAPAAGAAAAPAAGATPAAPTAGAAAAAGADGGADPSSSSSSGGGKGRGWLSTALIVALPVGAYYAYEHSRDQYMTETSSDAPGQRHKPLLPESLGSLVSTSKQALSSILPSQISSMVGLSPPTDDKLQTQKQADAELGFTLLPPEGAQAAAGAAAGASETAAAADAAAAASAAARDAMSAAADEFPGLTSAGAAKAEKGPFADAHVEHVDMAPIHALFSEVANTDLTSIAHSGSSSTSTTSSSTSPGVTADDANRIVAAMTAVAASNAQQQKQQPASAPTPGPAATQAQREPAAATEYHSDSELDLLCRQLGLPQDLTPSGLIAAAHAAGLGPYSSSGTPVPAQMAQLNQASSDARLLGGLLQQLAARQSQLEGQLEAARKEKAWAEEAGKKREESLTEHFKELLREQARIQQQITAAAVRQAEDAVMADTAAAHLEERRLRGAAVDELRGKVNALALAFDTRTAQVQSAHEVLKVSLGVLALSRALEEGQPIGPQLKDLAAGCPGDPLVEAVAASLPPTAATAGLPTLQQLQQQFKAVARAASEAAYFTGEGEGGVLARLTAKLAVRLKVDAGESAADSPDSKISQASALLQQGKLLAAADVLSAAAAGTQAAAVVQQWVDNARARAVANQAVQLLQAHATTTAVAAKA